MSDLIVANEIAGGAVYGIPQYDYTVGTATGQDYIAALTAAAFKESVALESSAAAYADVVRQRERKIDDLGTVLAVLAEAIATMDPKSHDTGKMSTSSTAIYNAQQVADSYGLGFTVVCPQDKVAAVSFAVATDMQDKIQYAMDTEDNNLKQDSVALQSLISKRDNAYSAAAKLVKKGDGTAANTIRNIC